MVHSLFMDYAGRAHTHASHVHNLLYMHSHIHEHVSVSVSAMASVRPHLDKAYNYICVYLKQGSRVMTAKMN